jgi:hypothetical protein
MRATPLLAALCLLLAGCSQAGDDKGGALPPADFEELELQATASTGVLRGIVVDEAIRPLANATVTLLPSERMAITTASGTFGFDELAPGTYFIKVEKPGYNGTQTSTDVVAGVAEPPIVKVLLVQNPSLAPYLEALHFSGFLSFGAAVGITSVGTTIYPQISEALDDHSIWTVPFTVAPTWSQGELVWKHNQAAGGMMIWEMVVGNTNDFKGYRETAESPALAFWNTTVLMAEAGNVTDPDHGIAYRFFGGPHPLLAPVVR